VNVEILIPTCKSEREIIALLQGIELMDSYNEKETPVIYSCLENASAARNRNFCLDLATAPYLVMMDDDIRGFHPGWVQKLVEPLVSDENILYVSARLLNKDCTPQHCVGFVKQMHGETVRARIAPTACIAIRNDGIRFNEDYLGSGWEDVSFHCRMKRAHPDRYPVINNKVKMIHYNEMKNQKYNFLVNRNIFDLEFPGERVRLGL
jgi:glycosyltransferase involved in cell wall biosynthesis